MNPSRTLGRIVWDQCSNNQLITRYDTIYNALNNTKLITYRIHTGSACLNQQVAKPLIIQRITNQSSHNNHSNKLNNNNTHYTKNNNQSNSILIYNNDKLPNKLRLQLSILSIQSPLWLYFMSLPYTTIDSTIQFPQYISYIGAGGLSLSIGAIALLQVFARHTIQRIERHGSDYVISTCNILGQCRDQLVHTYDIHHGKLTYGNAAGGIHYKFKIGSSSELYYTIDKNVGVVYDRDELAKFLRYDVLGTQIFGSAYRHTSMINLGKK